MSISNLGHQYKNRELLPKKSFQWVMLSVGIVGLVMVYLFQDFSYSDALVGGIDNRWFAFVGNKVIRFLLNDIFTLCVIFSLFFERKYMLFALYVQLIGLFVLLPAYLSIKFYWGDTYRNLDANLHRIVMNPVLLMLLIPAFYIQKFSKPVS